jgi:hypothetical protein
MLPPPNGDRYLVVVVFLGELKDLHLVQYANLVCLLLHLAMLEYVWLMHP